MVVVVVEVVDVVISVVVVYSMAHVLYNYEHVLITEKISFYSITFCSYFCYN